MTASQANRQADTNYQICCSGCGVRTNTADGGNCRECGARVQVIYEKQSESLPDSVGRVDMWQYRPLLPIAPDVPIVTMGEGGTPLVRSRTIGPSIGVQELYFKLEACNPTGSFKDRIASLMTSRYASMGINTLLTITSGNAGSALAAYTARAGLRCVVLQMAEAPVSKRLQLYAHGATVIALEGLSGDAENLERAFDEMVAVGRAQGWPVCIMSHFYDPINVEAYKTIAYEISDNTSANPPDDLYVPVGGGGLFAAMWKGFKEFKRLGRISHIPSMVAVQPAGAASVAKGFDNGKADAERVVPETKISGVGGSYTSDGDLIINALKETGGHCCSPDDQQCYAAQTWLARGEGIFAEPAGALSVAAVIQDAQRGRSSGQRRVVCVITGSGFKDREAAERLFMPQEVPSLCVGELDRIPSFLDR